MNKGMAKDGRGRFQRARGSLKISTVCCPRGSSRLQNLHQEGSSRAIFPRTINGTIEAVILNTAGGVTGGDTFSTSFTVEAFAKKSITTQAAERIYCSHDLSTSSIYNQLHAKPNSQLYWLPQETILFEGSRLCRRLKVEVGRGTKFLMLEPLVFGREASGENLHSCSIDDSVSIKFDGKIIYYDRVKLNGNLTQTLKRAAIANGARAMASIVLVDPKAKVMLEGVRALLAPNAGVSLLKDNILVIRLVCLDSFSMRTALLPILEHLTQNTVPKNWRL